MLFRSVRAQGRDIAMKPEVGMALIQPNGDVIVQTYGLHDGPEIMEAVGTAVQDSKYQVGFGGSADRDRRGRWNGTGW